MAELKGREVQIESHVGTPDVDKVIVIHQDGTHTSEFLKDLDLNEEEIKKFQAEKQKVVIDKVHGWRNKSKQKNLEHPVSEKVEVKTAEVKAEPKKVPGANKANEKHLLPF